jgi:hypothetical protein
MRQLFPSSAKKPPEVSLSPAGLVESFDPVHALLMTATAAKIKMEARQADVALAAAVMAGAMTPIWNVVPVAAVPAIAAMTWRVVTAGAMAGVVSVAVAWRVVTAGTMTGVVPASVIEGMAGTVPATMTGTAGVMISRSHCGGTEYGEACSDSQDDDELFHGALGLSLSCPRHRAACKF